MKEKNKGVTLIVLAVTITVLLIISGIILYSGQSIIKQAQLEELKTNMLLIQAKAKEYVEQATFKMGISPDEAKKQEVRTEVYENNARLQKASNLPNEFKDVKNADTCYWLTKETQDLWGLDKIELEEDEKYLIEFNENDVTVEVYNTIGYNGKYSLTEVDKIEEAE